MQNCFPRWKFWKKTTFQLFHKPPSLIHGYTEWTWNKLKTVSFSECRSSDCRLVGRRSKTDQSSLRLFTSREFFPPATLFGNSPTKRPTDDHLLCTTLVYNVYSGYSVLYSLAMYSTLSITFLPTPYNPYNQLSFSEIYYLLLLCNSCFSAMYFVASHWCALAFNPVHLGEFQFHMFALHSICYLQSTCLQCSKRLHLFAMHCVDGLLRGECVTHCFLRPPLARWINQG